MCLITEQKRVKILKEDLIVYKNFHIVDNLIRPWTGAFRHKIEYKVGKLHKQTLGVDNIPDSVYDIKVKDAYKLETPLASCTRALQLTHVHEGFHATIIFDRLVIMPYPGYVIFKCRIPKGARVFKDKTGLIVSDTIILEEQI